MALKGINPLEAHCEKIVVGLAGAALVGIVVWQFVGGVPKVRLGSQEPELTDAYDVLERRAKQLKGQLEGSASDSLPPEDMPLGLLAQAGDFSTTTVAPSRKLAIAFGTSGIPVEGGLVAPGGDQGTRFAEITPPAPQSPVAGQIAGTVHPAELTVPGNEGLAQLVAAPDRPDLVAVSVEAMWPASSYFDQMRLDPDGPEGPIEPIPAVWYNGPDMTIVDVEMLRQKLLPDGSWGEEMTVAAMPGRRELRAEMAEEGQDMSSLEQLRFWTSQAAEFAEDIRRPPFYAIVYGDDWVPPSEMDLGAKLAVANPEERTLREQLDRVRRQIAASEQQLADLGGGGEGGRPGHGHGGPRPNQTENEQNARRRATIERNLETYRKREQEIIDRLIQIGAKNIPGVEQVDPIIDPGMGQASESAGDPPLIEADQIRIWAHDVAVERGATYRYKLRVWVTNPFFGHDAGLVDEQKPLAASPLLASEPSEWTEPVKVHDEAYYFITSANEGGLPGVDAGARATASVYVFRWGYWREGSARMEPGDALATTIQCPMLGEQLAQAVPPDDGMQPRGPHGHPAAPAPGGGQEADPAAAAPQVAYEPVPVTREVVLLDVGPLPNAAGKVAYLREENGVIVSRDPDSETGRQIYMLLQASAKRGAEMLKPKEVAPASAPEQPRRRPDDHRPQPGDMSPTSPSGPGGG